MKKKDVGKVYGKIKFVDQFEDYRVKEVKNSADLHVKVVKHFEKSPGRWKIVDHFEDYKIKKVKNSEDFRIKFVDHFEGPQ